MRAQVSASHAPISSPNISGVMPAFRAAAAWARANRRKAALAAAAFRWGFRETVVTTVVAISLVVLYGRASDLKKWYAGVTLNNDLNLRLQYMAGLGLNFNNADAIAKQIPNKPIRFIVNSHQHFDAIGGLRTYHHIGATLVTSFHNFDLYKHDVINYAARTKRPDMVSQWPPTELAEGYNYEVVRENYVIEDAGRVMRMLYINPLQHAEGMLVAYLPKEKMLLESDIINTDNPLPAMPTRDMTSLYTMINRMKFDVQTIVPMHGKPMPWADFAKMFTAARQTASAAN